MLDVLTGTGIPRDHLARILEPFVQVPNATGGGAGLGLTISRRIVEAHGGELSVQSGGRRRIHLHVHRSRRERSATMKIVTLLNAGTSVSEAIEANGLAGEWCRG